MANAGHIDVSSNHYPMPTVSGSQLLPPKSWDEFEEICADLFSREWRDANAARHGRNGQRQSGVDIYGTPAAGTHVGVQCKGKRSWPPTQLTNAEIDREVKDALNFSPKLTEYIIATTALDDVEIQEHVREITERHRASGLFRVHVVGWSEIVRRLTQYPELVQKHYGYASVSLVAAEVAAIPERTADRTVELLTEKLGRQNVASFDTSKSLGDLATEHNAQIDEIRSLVTSGKPRSALDMLERLEHRIWQSSPNSIRYRLKAVRAFCHEAIGDLAVAASILAEAEKLDPSRPAAQANAAYALLLNGNKDAARKKIQAVSEAGLLDPIGASILIAASADDLSISDPLNLVPLALQGHPQVTFAAGQFFRKRGDLVKAIECFKHGLTSERLTKIVYGETLLEAIFGAEEHLPSQLGERQRADAELAHSLLADAWSEITKSEIESANLNVVLNLSNSLRLLGKGAEARELIQDARLRHSGNPHLLRQAIYMAMQDDNIDEALALLESESAKGIAEREVLRAEVLASKRDWDGVLRSLEAFPEMPVEAPFLLPALRLKAEALARRKSKDAALTFINKHGQSSIACSIARAYACIASNDPDEARKHACAAQELLNEMTTKPERLAVAECLFDTGEPSLSADLLKSLVNTSSPSPLVERYIQALYRANRDSEALEAIGDSSAANRTASLWRIKASIEERAGDLRSAVGSYEKLLEKLPNSTATRLQWLRLNLRLRETEPVRAFLNTPPAVAPGHEEMQLAYIYDEIGRADEALSSAYRALTHANENAEINRAYIFLMLKTEKDDDKLLKINSIAVDTAFAVSVDGKDKTFIVEGDETLPMAGERISPTHPLAQRAIGLQVGSDLLVAQSEYSRTVGRVVSIKHKLVHVLHDAMERFNMRFPGEAGLTKITFKGNDEGIKIVEKLVNNRAEYAKQLESFYLNHAIPISTIASLTSHHVIEVAAAFGSDGGPGIRSCVGSREERELAFSILKSSTQGLLLDSLTLINAYNLGVHHALSTVFGKLGITQQTIDELSAELAERRMGKGRGFFTVASVGGSLVGQEVTAEHVEQTTRHLEGLRDWMISNCDIIPSLFPRPPLGETAELIRILGSEFGALLGALAYSKRTLLSDDLHLRALIHKEAGTRGAWLQVALTVCLERKAISLSQYQDSVLKYVHSNYGFISIDTALVSRVVHDSKFGREPIWSRLTQRLSGAEVDLVASLSVAGPVIVQVWSSMANISDKERILFSLLGAILTGHWADTYAVLRALRRVAASYSWIESFEMSLRTWCRGHFLTPPF